MQFIILHQNLVEKMAMKSDNIDSENFWIQYNITGEVVFVNKCSELLYHLSQREEQIYYCTVNKLHFS